MLCMRGYVVALHVPCTCTWSLLSCLFIWTRYALFVSFPRFVHVIGGLFAMCCGNAMHYVIDIPGCHRDVVKVGKKKFWHKTERPFDRSRNGRFQIVCLSLSQNLCLHVAQISIFGQSTFEFHAMCAHARKKHFFPNMAYELFVLMLLCPPCVCTWCFCVWYVGEF